MMYSIPVLPSSLQSCFTNCTTVSIHQLYCILKCPIVLQSELYNCSLVHISHIHHKNFANGTAKGNLNAIVEDNYSRSNLLTTNYAADIISFYNEMLNQWPKALSLRSFSGAHDCCHKTGKLHAFTSSAKVTTQVSASHNKYLDGMATSWPGLLTTSPSVSDTSTANSASRTSISAYKTTV